MLEAELLSIRSQRNSLCDAFLEQRCDIPHFCIELDVIGKKLADNYLFANLNGQGKSTLEGLWPL